MLHTKIFRVSLFPVALCSQEPVGHPAQPTAPRQSAQTEAAGATRVAKAGEGEGKARPTGAAGAAKPGAAGAARAGAKADLAGSARGVKGGPTGAGAAAKAGAAGAGAAGLAGASQSPRAKVPKSKPNTLDKMRAQLAGGRFRSLNEQLYTTSGDEALRMMQVERGEGSLPANNQM